MPARLSLEDAKQAALKFNGRCLSQKYINASVPMEWECEKGHKWTTRLNNIKHMGSWCPCCARTNNNLKLRNKYKIEQTEILNNLVRSKGGQWDSAEYSRSDIKVTFICASGHKWKANPSEIIHQGNWCPECSTGIGERLVRTAIEHLTAQPFPKCRPDWLKSTGGRKMELDGYNEQLRLAFEHQGRQHYRVNFFTKTRSNLNKRISADRRKYLICKKRSIKLITIPQVGADIQEQDLEQYLRKKLSEALPRLKLNKSPVNYLTAYKSDQATEALANLKRVAVEKGGVCIDEEYKGQGNNRYTFKCANGHIWKSLARIIIHTKSWCPKCAIKTRAQSLKKSVNELIKHAEKLGGKFLSLDNPGRQIRNKWQCGLGHRWLATPNQVLSQKTWCPVCAEANRGNNTEKKTAGLKRMNLLAAKQKGKCISTEYLNTRSKLEWECKFGHRWLAKPMSIAEGSWCPFCWAKRRSGKK